MLRVEDPISLIHRQALGPGRTVSPQNTVSAVFERASRVGAVGEVMSSCVAISPHPVIDFFKIDGSGCAIEAWWRPKLAKAWAWSHLLVENARLARFRSASNVNRDAEVDLHFLGGGLPCGLIGHYGVPAIYLRRMFLLNKHLYLLF